MKKLPIGISDFKKIREENRYFVDKSLFIKEIINEDAEITLLPRPRRFGKTLNLSMLKYFFEKIDNSKSIEKLFSGLLIEKEKIFKKYLCKHPVIYLTFKDINSLTFENALKSLKLLIAREYQRHSYLLKSNALDEYQKNDFNSIATTTGDISLFESSLRDLSYYLYKHHKKKVIVLIDEYDTPIHIAFTENYYKEAITFFKSFLGGGLKDNPNIFKGVLSGILRIAKESIFSDINNLGVYTLISNKFSDKFGLTEKEVLKFLKFYNQTNLLNNIKLWYDGYIFGNNAIYNPWSIINYIANISDGEKPYWANTSSNQIIKKLISSASQSIKEDLYDLLKGIPVTKKIDENIVFEDLEKNDNTVYSFLLFTGYLKAFESEVIQEKTYYKLAIPNLEVKQIFEDIISKWINESFENHKLRAMLKSLTEGDITIFENILNDFVLETFSYFDTAKKNVEKVYQAFILGLLVNLSANYEINSEKESDFGRYDISIIPKNKDKKAIIMELKKLNSGETKDQALDNALTQIKEKKYETAILKHGIKKILHLAVVFDGKKVWVKPN